MKKLTILSILLCLVMSTVKAQLIDYTYNSDNSGIAFNEVTRITIDEKRDLIWLTHYTSNNGNGLSVARLNSYNTAVQSVSTPNVPTTIYDLSGRRIANPTKGIYIKQGNKFFSK